MLFQYGYGNFGNVGYYLQYWGIFDVILPFMLVFAITFAALNQLEVFKQKNIQITIAFVIALMFIGPHMTGGTSNLYTRTIGVDPVVVINQAVPHVGIIAVAATLALIMAGLFGFKGAEAGGLRSGALALSVIGIIAIFMHSLGWFQSWLWFLSDPGLQMAILALLVFGGLVMFMVGGDGGAPPSGG